MCSWAMRSSSGRPNAERIASNLDIFDFELAAEHMDAINGLNDGTRLRPDPDYLRGA